ncbi:MAG TPA: hypothetical protein VFO52_08870 [Longimicrobiales bacterium]|nr:hypothetical protein [Longimicrobiales bacterium]
MEKQHPFGKVLKWAGGITALLSLVFGLQQLTQMVSDTRERKRNTDELYRVGKLQQSASDYPAAWATFETALQGAEPGGQLAKLTGQLDGERVRLRAAQEDLAMQWLENLRIKEGENFTDAVAPLAAIITRGITTATDTRKADLLAHFGWANFLRHRDGQHDLTPEPQYREALAIDSLNPYARAYLAHWKLWSDHQEAWPEARAHFEAALRSGRARTDVRRMQLAAIGNLGDGEIERLRVLADMVKNKEPVDGRTISRAYGDYWSVCHRHWNGMGFDLERFEAVRKAIPLADHIAIFQTLFTDFDRWRSRERDACLALLLEKSGQRQEALQIWTKLRAAEADDSVWVRYGNTASKRLSQAQP